MLFDKSTEKSVILSVAISQMLVGSVVNLGLVPTADFFILFSLNYKLNINNLK